MASDPSHRLRQTAASVLVDAREALAAPHVDARRWMYLALLEAVAVEAVAIAGLGASLTFTWPHDATTYSRRVLLHENEHDARVLRTAFIIEPDPREGRGMTRVWMGGSALPHPPSRMMDAEVPSWTNATATACSAL